MVAITNNNRAEPQSLDPPRTCAEVPGCLWFLPAVLGALHMLALLFVPLCWPNPTHHSKPWMSPPPGSSLWLRQVELAAPSQCWNHGCLSGGANLDREMEGFQCYPLQIRVGIPGLSLTGICFQALLNLIPYL